MATLDERLVTAARLATDLAGKAPTSHTHGIPGVTGLQDALDGKAPVGHSHPISGVTGLQGALDGKADAAATTAALDGKAPAQHTHGTAQVVGLDATLAGKVDTATLDARLEGITTAYELALAEGFMGTIGEWLLSLVGPQGPEGPYGGTAVTDPQVASYVTGDTETQAALDARYLTALSVTRKGATGDGVTDDTTAVQAALTSAGTFGLTVFFPAGHYILTAALTVPDGVTIAGAGSHSVVLDWSTMPAFTATSLLAWAKGTTGPASSLVADTARGDGTLTVSPGHGFVPGDLVRVLSDEVILTGEATKAEFQYVLQVAGDVITLGGPLLDSYTTAAAGRVEKAELTTGGLSGVSIVGKGVNPEGYGDTVVEFSLARDVSIDDVKFRHVENKCLLLNSVVGLNIERCFFTFDPSFTPLQYGIAVTGACQEVSVRGCHSRFDRHLFTTSHSGTLLASRTEYRGIPRFVTITGCTAYGSWQAPIDTHRGGEYISIVGNALSSESVGIKVRSAHVLISGNTIVGKRVSKGGGPNGVYVGMLGDDVKITGNLIRGFDIGVRIDTPDGTTRDLAITDNTIVDCYRGVYPGATAKVVEVRIAGNLIRALDGGTPIFFFAPVDDVEIVGNTLIGGHTGIFMSHPTNPINRLVVQANTFRGQATRAAYFRFVYDASVMLNFAPGKEFRFTDECLGVVTALNTGTITDLTTGSTIDQR